ncbi:long-chain fatty acid--CoA ligase [Accumulibacter sp.]|uniref:AMP-dependent synthetase/ligase n=1 Tax=Accumulibacter sp. TaxID=2053492 RepID=UPI00260060D3|nr:AMP-binding protein [Accumulibacter sp.]MCM8594496.1 AMP-binding protein [Accumulibacter sp.]MCM8626761.1 AMP-binding protein [Accumulibacter sp.]MDS4048642.1 AMP-binding protein [Accumulibacter sp.]
MSRWTLTDPVLSASGWTVPGILEARSELTPDEPALFYLAADGSWVGIHWRSYRDKVAAIANGLRERGLLPGERVGIMAPSCPEWDFVQLGTLAAGGVAVGLDPYARDEHLREIGRCCGFAALVVAHPSLLDRIGDGLRQRLRFVVCFDPAGRSDVVSLATLLAASPRAGQWNEAQPDAPATIVFTSGTTGEPRGIEYSHRQMCLACSSILSTFPQVAAGSRLACWLPLSNLFQRMINLCAIGRGAQTFYVGDPREIMRHVRDIAPDLFIGVPRFYEKLHAGIEEAIAAQPSWRQRLARWAWRVGDRHAAACRDRQGPAAIDRLQFALADRLVLQPMRAALGGKLSFMVSGSAPMPVWLLERFHALGLPVLEAYGVSENIIPVAINRPDCFRLGTVGQPAPGSEIRLADDGELLVRGPGVFAGYLGEDARPPTLDSDGYLATGDFARIDDDGFVTLIGRKSEVFKTSTGRRIAPSAIENRLQQVAQVEQAVVFGAGRPRPVALLVLTEAAWREGGGSAFADVRRALATASNSLPAHERPAGFAFTAQALTIDGGELTANLKLRRHVIASRRSAAVQALYDDLDAARDAPFAAWSGDRQTFHCSA